MERILKNVGPFVLLMTGGLYKGFKLGGRVEKVEDRKQPLLIVGCQGTILGDLVTLFYINFDVPVTLFLISFNVVVTLFSGLDLATVHLDGKFTYETVSTENIRPLGRVNRLILSPYLVEFEHIQS